LSVTQTEHADHVDEFRHEALFYTGEDEFVSAISAFARGGAAAGEPTLVVVSQRRIDLLREALGPDAEHVHFADMANVGANPARIIPAWRDFVGAHGGSGVGLRGVGEPIFPERSPDELIESQRHESLLNLAFADAGSFWLVCPYDTDALEPAVIEEARRSHPFLTDGEDRSASSEYSGLEAVSAPFAAALPAPPAETVELHIDDHLEAVRRFVADHAERAGLSRERIVDLVLALNEIATNSVRHGGGHGVLRIWNDDRRLVCEVRDRGSLDNPLADRELAPLEQPGGRGLWIANQLCDLVQIRCLPDGMVVRLHMAFS
jgi:anti-sigma regulatory factor (Ser/Thr protein kinase)